MDEPVCHRDVHVEDPNFSDRIQSMLLEDVTDGEIYS